MKKVIKRRPTTILPYNNRTWTSAQLFGTIRAAIRNAFRYNWVPAKIALENASRPSQSKNKRLKKEYICTHCEKWFPRVECEIDHKSECGSLKSFEDVQDFLKRFLLEDPKDYQILCKPCHKIKTKEYMSKK